MKIKYIILIIAILTGTLTVACSNNSDITTMQEASKKQQEAIKNTEATANRLRNQL